MRKKTLEGLEQKKPIVPTVDTAQTKPTKNQTLDTPVRAVTSDDIDRAEKEVPGSGKSREAASLGQGGFGSVDEHSGSYAYKIPVAIPTPQNGGPSPEVSIVYNSMRSGAPSLIGAGWRLELGRIERLSLYEDGVDFKNNQGTEFPNDHFILRLNGKTYTMVNVHNHPNQFRVKIEKSFARAYRILSSTIDPVSEEPEIDCWVVVLADGTRYRFGVEGKAGADEVGGELQNKVWNIVSIENTYGQKVLYEYAAYKNKENTHWKEMVYSYPTRIKCGVTADEKSWDSMVEFTYRTDDPPNPHEGYGNLGIQYTGRELEEGNGYTCILWKRLKKIRTFFRGKTGEFLPNRDIIITAEEENGRFLVRQVKEAAYKDGKIDQTAQLPPHRFAYIFKDESNPAVLKTAVTPMNKTEELTYGLASQVDKGTPQAVDDVYLVQTYTEKAGSESWTKAYEYWDGKNYTPFDEFRGHGRVDVIDRETGKRTETYFVQNGVHNKSIKEQISYDAEGKKISHQESKWMALDYNGGRYMPFKQITVTRTYAEDGKTVLSTKIKKISETEQRNIPWKYALDEYGNALVEIEETHEGDRAENDGSLLVRKKTVTLYKNVEEGDGDAPYRLIGLPVDIKRYAMKKEDPDYQLIEWKENTYNDNGQVIEEITHFDREDAGEVFKKVSEYHPVTGKVLKKFRFNGREKLLEEENRYYQEGPYCFLKSHAVNARGQVEETREYDLQARKPSYVVQRDGITARTSYDGLGRTIEEVFVGQEEQDPRRRDANKDSVRYIYTLTPGERSIETHYIHTPQKKKEFFDSLDRKYRVLETGYRGRWIVKEDTVFDHRTRKPGRVSEPHYEDESPPAFRVMEYNEPRLRRTKEIHPGGKVVRMVYSGLTKTTFEDIYDRDDRGKPVKLLHTQLKEEESKDALDRVIRRAAGQAEGGRYEIFFSYDTAGRLVKITDNMQITLMTADFGSRMDDKPVKSMDVSLGKVSREYDGLGRVTESRRDFKGDLDRVSTMVYDKLDRVIGQTDRDTVGGAERVVESEYDTALHGVGKLARQKVRETNSLGRYIYEKRYCYDEFCLPASILHEWHVQWSVGDNSIEKSLEVQTDYFHNGRKGGRLERVSNPIINGMDLGRGITEYIYDDASGLLEEIRFNGAPVWRVPDGEFTARNKVKHAFLGNGIDTSFDYDAETGRLLEFDTRQEDSSLFNYRLGYDSAGNVRQKRITSVQPNEKGSHSQSERPVTSESTYLYDDKNQLLEAVQDGIKKAFVYKANGSRTRFSDGEREILYIYDGSGLRPHQVAALGGDEERRFSYDRAGNMVQDEKKKNGSWYTRRFGWNPANKVQQVEVLNPQQQVIRRLCFGYGGENKRVVKYDMPEHRLTFYIDNIAEVEYRLRGEKEQQTLCFHILNGTRRTATYRWEDEPGKGQLHYYHRDLLNSVILVTGEKGNVLEAPFYEPFGKVRKADDNSPTDILFTGHRADVADCEGFRHFDFKARVYEPELGIFISPDEVDDHNNAAFGFNRYIYVNNNPTSKWDPTGNQGDDEEETGSPSITIQGGAQITFGWNQKTETRILFGGVKDGFPLNLDDLKNVFRELGISGREEFYPPTPRLDRQIIYRVTADLFSQNIPNLPELMGSAGTPPGSLDTSSHRHINPINIWPGANPVTRGTQSIIDDPIRLPEMNLTLAPSFNTLPTQRYPSPIDDDPSPDDGAFAPPPELGTMLGTLGDYGESHLFHDWLYSR